jgi:hypothetical protein
MFALNVTIRGDKVIIDGLREIAADMPRIVQRGLKKVARGIHREAMALLNGSGGQFNYETRTSKSGKQYQKQGARKMERYSPFSLKDGSSALFTRFSDSGGYPVPVRTGNLKRLLDFLDPNTSKGGFTANPGEVIVYNSAEYANVIHEGRGSSAKFGPRPFLTDALAKFNQGGQIAATLENEVTTALKKRGLA